MEGVMRQAQQVGDRAHGASGGHDNLGEPAATEPSPLHPVIDEAVEQLRRYAQAVLKASEAGGDDVAAGLGALLSQARFAEEVVSAQAAARRPAIHAPAPRPDHGTGEAPAPGTTSDPRLIRALAFIEANLGAAIGLDDIASKAGVSKFHFTRLFHEKVGRTPMQHLLERRLDLAAATLVATDLPVSQVAFRSGFLNVTHFNGRFRRRFGRSPSAYRRGHLSPGSPLYVEGPGAQQVRHLEHLPERP